MTAVNPAYYHYSTIIQTIGRMTANMTKRKLKCDPNGYLYYDGVVGRIYVGQKDMVDKGLFTIEKEAEQDMKSIFGVTKATCAYCNGYGIWAEDYAPFTFDEVTWCLSHPCEKCGSNNHLEYMNAARGGGSPPWIETKGIGLKAAMEKFKRNTSCVESSDTQVAKTVQG